MREQWIGVVASPNKVGNSALLTSYVAAFLESRGAWVKIYYLGTAVQSCTGCEACFKTGSCVYKDEVSAIHNEIKTADGLILASPSYNYNMTAPMKAFLDRTFCFGDYSQGKWQNRLDAGKKAVLIGVCRGREPECMGYTTLGMQKTVEELDFNLVEVINYLGSKALPVVQNRTIQQEIVERLTAKGLD